MDRRFAASTLGAVGDRLLIAAALVVGLASLLALAARMSWLAELFAHFRVQYLIVQLPLTLTLLARKRVLAGVTMLPLIAVNIAAVADYWPRGYPAPTSAADLKLMTVNLNVDNDDAERFVALVRAERPDALVLLEVTAAWRAALGPLLEEYPSRWFATREDPFGIAVLARTALEAPRTLSLGDVPAIDATLLAADRRVRLLGVHLSPPVTSQLAGARNAQLDALRELVRETAGPLIVTGDFNATPYSPRLGDWLGATGLIDPRHGRGFTMTWPTSLVLLGVPIDHCFVSEHFMAGETRRSAAFGSDHYAIITELILR